jgi:rare lipoprotein A
MKKLVLFVCLALAYFSTPAHALPPEIGIANYYGDQFHGSKTASEEIYDKDQLTAAHKTLPYGTVVRVTVLATGASVDVRINDRGPFVKGRVITLSRKAAETLNIFKEEAPQVKLEVVQKSEAPVKPAAVVSDKPLINDNPVANNPVDKAADKAIADKAAADKAAADKMVADKKAADKAAADKIVADKKAADKLADRKAADKLADRKAADKIASEKALTDKAAADKKDLATNKTKSAIIKPTEKTGNQPTTKPATNAPTTTRPSAEPALNFVKEAGKMSQGHLYKMQVLQMEEVGFGVQIAAYSDYEGVFDQLSILQENHFKGGLVYVDEVNGKNYYKVIVGPFFTREEAASYCNSLRKKNNMKDAFVVDLDKLNAKAQAVSIAPGNATTPTKTSAKVVTPATKKTGK